MSARPCEPSRPIERFPCPTDQACRADCRNPAHRRRQIRLEQEPKPERGKIFARNHKTVGNGPDGHAQPVNAPAGIAPRIARTATSKHNAFRPGAI
tara:strand:+ start:136 stop:423 length:288 start_codon:yes stop_codon:yes gene_type:complete